MVSKSDVFKSRYTKAADLKDGPVVGKIRLAALETLRGYNGTEEEKVVVYFGKKLKPLILNRTNWDAIADIAGDESDDWAGTEVELYATTAGLRSKQVECVRVRKPDAKAAPKKKAPPTDDDLNDEIAF